MRLAKLSLFTLVCCIFIFVPDGLFRFTLPKLAVLAAGIALGIIAGSRVKLMPPVAWGAAAVMAAFTAAAVAADGLGSSFWGRWPRYEGVPTVAAYLLLLLVGARLLGPGADGAVRGWCSRLVSGTMLLLAAAALLEAGGVNLMGDAEGFRFGATLGNATDMGIVGLTGCAVLLPRAVFTKARWEQAGALAGGVVAIASGSRAVILVLALVLVGAAAWWGWRKRGSGGFRYAALWLIGSFSAVAVAILALPGVRGRFLDSETVTGRADLWEATWALVTDHWALGVGPGHFVDVLPKYQSEAFAAAVGTDFPADSPHLIVLQWLADGGVPLLVANVMLCAAVVWAGVRNLRTVRNDSDRLFLVGAMAAVCSFALVLLTHFPTPGTTVITALCAGAVCGVAPAPPAAGKGRARVASTQTIAAPASRARVLAAVSGACALFALAAAAGIGSAAEVHLKNGEAAVRDGRLAEASLQFETAASLRPWDADVALLAGQAFAGRAAAGDPGSGKLAAEWSRRSLQANPGSVESMTSLAVGQMAAGELAAAGQTLEKARAAAPVNSQIWLQSGLAEYAAGRTGTAISYVERAVAFTPDPAEERAVLEAIRSTRMGPSAGMPAR